MSIDAHAKTESLRSLTKRCVSVFVVSQNRSLSDTISSALSQPELLELIVADTCLSDINSVQIQRLQVIDPRVRCLRSPGTGKVELLNQAIESSRGTLLCYLDPDQLLISGALGRAVLALEQNRRWIMVHDQPLGIEDRVFAPNIVIWRRTMSVLLGPFDSNLASDFASDYWLRARQFFPGRIGLFPHLPGLTEPSQTSSGLLPPAVPSSDKSDSLASAQRAEPCIHLLPSIQLLGVVHPELSIADGCDKSFYEKHLVAGVLGYWQRYRLLSEDIELAKALNLTPDFHDCCKESIPFSQRPFGVNLVGHAFNRFGIGETVRLAARALHFAGIPYCVINHAADNGSSTTERSLEDRTLLPFQQGPYAFNLVWLAAPIHARWICHHGLSQLRNRYTIAAWFWETSLWPTPWEPVLEHADEIWACSSLIRKSLEPYMNCTDLRRRILLENMPIAAEVLDRDRLIHPQTRLASRQYFGLPADALIFSFGFDLNSSIHRKNPMAALQAFQMAFPVEADDAAKFALMIKTFPPASPSPAWDAIKQLAASDSRLYVIEADLQRENLLRLYGCCDAFLSLHRSEGFGLGMAEALQMGLDVIATDYGGNTDFCTGTQAHPVRFNLVPIPPGAYPHHQGQVWAEPDVAHAAKLLRAVADKRLSSRQDAIVLDSNLHYPDSSLLDDYQHRFAVARVGMEYRRRLTLLWSERSNLELGLKWKT